MGKTFVEDERPCDSCVNVTRYGCGSWKCEYINRDEAIKAWREKHEMADRKTENSSEKPNNSTISKMEQVEDEPQTDDKHAVCTGCDYYDLPNAFHPCASCVDFSKYKPKIEDEPQTDCAWR